MDKETFVRKWAELAAAKLRADNVDPSDLQAVRKTLLATVGGERLFQCWLEFNHGGVQLAIFELESHRKPPERDFGMLNSSLGV